jgi:hypothetical protein
MCMDTLAYARTGYKSFPRSARHLMQLIGSHQNPDTGWAYLSYDCLALEASLTRRRVIQLVALLEVGAVLEVRRGHGRGNVNFYRILREEDGLPVPQKRRKKVKSETAMPPEKVKFWAPPEPEKVKSETRKPLEALGNVLAKVVDTKEREEKADTPVDRSPVALQRLGLTPGSMAWTLLLESDEGSEPTPGTSDFGRQADGHAAPGDNAERCPQELG